MEERQLAQIAVEQWRCVGLEPAIDIQLHGVPQLTRHVRKPAKNRLAANGDELGLARDSLTRLQDVFEVGALPSGQGSAGVRPGA